MRALPAMAKPMIRPVRLTLFAWLIALLSLPRAHAEETEVPPPFGLKWGESAERIEDAVREADAKIQERRKDTAGQEIWEIKGLAQTGLQRAYFHMSANKLVEVELQYSKDDWSPATYDEFMQRVRKRIEDKYGPARLVARQKEDGEHGVLKTLVGYRWDLGQTSVELYYFSAQDPKNLFRTLSLHYKAVSATPAQ